MLNTRKHYSATAGYMRLNGTKWRGGAGHSFKSRSVSVKLLHSLRETRGSIRSHWLNIRTYTGILNPEQHTVGLSHV